MMENNTHTLAASLDEHIKYIMLKDVLVKPLAQILIPRVFEVPVVKETTVEDDENIIDYEGTTQETREVPSNFSRGVILKIPVTVQNMECAFKVGDTVIFNSKFAVNFDVLKDSKLVKPYDIIAVED